MNKARHGYTTDQIADAVRVAAKMLEAVMAHAPAAARLQVADDWLASATRMQREAFHELCLQRLCGLKVDA